MKPSLLYILTEYAGGFICVWALFVASVEWFLICVLILSFWFIIDWSLIFHPNYHIYVKIICLHHLIHCCLKERQSNNMVFRFIIYLKINAVQLFGIFIPSLCRCLALFGLLKLLLKIYYLNIVELNIKYIVESRIPMVDFYGLLLLHKNY